MTPNILVVYIDDSNSADDQRFIPVTSHQAADITKLAYKMSLRIARYLSRSGLIETDAENSYFSEISTDNEMTDHQSYSIHYRILTGFQKGKKVFLLQTRPPIVDDSQSLDTSPLMDRAYKNSYFVYVMTNFYGMLIVVFQ